MECKDFREQMTEYFAGTLEAHRRKALEEHVARCSECGEEFADFKDMVSAISGPVKVPQEFRDALKKMVAKEAKKQLPTGYNVWGFLKNPFFKVLIGATAASVLLLIAGLVWFDMIFPKPLPETVVSYIEDKAAGMEAMTRRGLNQLVPDNSATAEVRLFAKYSEDLAMGLDEKVVSIGGEVLNSANRSDPYALYGISPDVLSFFVNHLKTLGPVEASIPRITSVSSDTVYILVEIGL